MCTVHIAIKVLICTDGQMDGQEFYTGGEDWSLSVLAG